MTSLQMTSEEKTVTEIGENTNINIDSNVNDDDVNLDNQFEIDRLNITFKGYCLLKSYFFHTQSYCRLPY